MKVGAGEALAAGGLVVAAVTLLDGVGPGFSSTLSGDEADAQLRRHLTAAELATAVTVLGAAFIASLLMRATWPLVVGVAAVVVAIGTHELALRLEG